MTQYLILIHGDESRWDALSATERETVDAAHRDFQQRVGQDVLAAGELESSSAAVTLRTRTAGEWEATDGPFSESKEVVGGFYLIEADDRDAAVELAASLAEARQGHGGIQVHPLVTH